MLDSTAGQRTRVIGLTIAAAAIILIIPSLAMAGLPADVPRWPFMLVAVPHLVVLTLIASSRSPNGAAWGWVRGVALATQWILLTSGAIAALSVVWFVLNGFSSLALLLLILAGKIEAIGVRIGVPGIALLVVLLVTQLIASRVAKQVNEELSSDGSSSYALHTMLSFATLSLVAIASFTAGDRLSDPLDAHGAMKERKGRDVSRAVSAIVDVQRCAHVFMTTSGAHAYPATLAAIGPGGTGCLDSATASGQPAGEVMRYTPFHDSTGQVAHFWVMTRDATGRAGTLVYVGDDSGSLFETRYDSSSDRDQVDSVASLYPVHSPVKRLLDLSRCIHSTYASYLGEYPADLGADASTHHPAGRCISSPDRNSAVVLVDSGSAAGAVKFVLTYFPGPVNVNRGYPMTFALTARPVSYGDGTIRSFVLVNDTLRVTSSARGATLADPLVSRCEMNVPSPCTLVRPDVKTTH